MKRPELPILYCDEEMVAVHKPAGLLVHRTYLERRESHFALQLVRDQLGSRVYPAHRLDRPTSGVLLFARSRNVAGILGTMLQSGSVEKRYFALVRGWVEPHGVIDHPLVDLDATNNSATPPRQARTIYNMLERYELPFAVGRYPSSRYALIELRPQSGRRHQLRRHMKHVFHPLIGDTNYGEGRHNRYFREHFACHRLMLAATSLSFAHPRSGTELAITCEPESSFTQVLTQLSRYRV